ncbi:tyrosine-type recombinase/integrase [Legionella longbeachae]|uniref:Putative integrase n=1 Tax=Legionella longbeachae serogroup 1 (strain NSW150) TaxID=661367 RepID=D3HNH0_LEGLN|nr:site-specific integrase [Legionella longbeachae]VEE00959.1 integrase [Legionella oakridgensis]HBD7399072.1 site-specific integrase [Legionella pneumophila]ARB92654.1 site-specific integrase [Legionella longbeachae]ARM34171.1 site-specific integrase [Legionella longbeachae]EEZ96576.1 phage integrase family site-specific recombinase [Legionella longbeachae D-4968]
MNLLDRQNSKNQEFVIDKIFHPLDVHFDTNFLSAWLSYYSVHVKGSPEKTGKAYKATTINRTMATIRHEGRWLHQQRPLLAGDLLAQVKDVQTDTPDWNGLTSRQLMRLKSACEQRIKSCTRKNQNPIMETALFYVLLGTGLRESEVVTLTIGQYRQKGLYDVLRHKSKRVSQKIPLPQESREYLDQYLTLRKGLDDEPLFITRYGTALKTLDVYRICQRVLKQALTYLPESEQFSFTPHQLRHTFLKKVTDKHGVHFAQELSGNVSIKEIFRYAKPSQEEMQETIEELFA